MIRYIVATKNLGGNPGVTAHFSVSMSPGFCAECWIHDFIVNPQFYTQEAFVNGGHYISFDSLTSEGFALAIVRHALNCVRATELWTGDKKGGNIDNFVLKYLPNQFTAAVPSNFGVMPYVGTGGSRKEVNCTFEKLPYYTNANNGNIVCKAVIRVGV